MSQQLINLSPELKRLRDEGLGVDVNGGCLLVTHLPYLTTTRNIAYGTLAVKLNLASDEKLCEVTDHCAFFAGDLPCDMEGRPMVGLAVDNNETQLGGVTVRHRFSRHPFGRQYRDYYELVTTYIGLICTPAETLDSQVQARSFPLIEESTAESVFL